MNEMKLTELDKNITKKTITQFIVNCLGINLSSVKDIRVSRDTSGQLKDIHIVFNPSYVNGSQKLVAEWQANNPQGKKVDCYRDTGVSRPTINKYWNSNEGEERSEVSDKITFGILKKGDRFFYQEDEMIKTCRIKAGNDGSFYTAVSIVTGNHYCIADDLEVYV